MYIVGGCVGVRFAVLGAGGLFFWRFVLFGGFNVIGFIGYFFFRF